MRRQWLVVFVALLTSGLTPPSVRAEDKPVSAADVLLTRDTGEEAFIAAKFQTEGELSSKTQHYVFFTDSGAVPGQEKLLVIIPAEACKAFGVKDTAELRKQFAGKKIEIRGKIVVEEYEYVSIQGELGRGAVGYTSISTKRVRIDVTDPKQIKVVK